MEEEEAAVTKVDIVWPREFALQRKNNSCLCLIRIVAAKLAQAGFGHFLADTHVRKLKGKA